MPRKKTRKRTKPGEIPQILHFRPRNLAYILLGGRKEYLGHYDGIVVSAEVEAERLRKWSEYKTGGNLDPGMRPGEMLAMRAEDIYRDGDEFPDGYEFPPLKGCWVYIPEEHKTEHHGKIRFVMLGGRCQEILTPYLMDVEGVAGEFLFSPERAVALSRLDRRRKRKSKVQPSQLYRRKENPKRKPGKRYNKDSYRTAIQRAVERRNLAEEKAAEREGRKAKPVKKWFPNQLRHVKATELRAKYGIEVARIVLGHSRLSTTEIYAEPVKQNAIDIAAEWG